MLAPAYNASDQPAVIDAQGRVIGGREWGTVDTTAEQTKAALERGQLVLHAGLEVGDETAPEAVEAVKATTELQSRAEAFGSLEREELGAVAFEAGLIASGDELPHKAELVETLARSKVPAQGKDSADGAQGGAADEGSDPGSSEVSEPAAAKSAASRRGR